MKREQEILRNRPHQSRRIPYKQFLETMVPKIREAEPHSRGILFYVCVNHERRDFFDMWSGIDFLISHLQQYANTSGIPFETMWTDVYVWTHSSDAHKELIDPLLAEGYRDIAGDVTKNMANALQKGESEAAIYRLGLLDILSDPRRHEELMRPREAAVKAVQSIRDPNIAARIATTGVDTTEAAKIIANTARKEAQQNRAVTARAARNRIRKTVRNRPRLPENVTKTLHSYLTGRIATRQPSKTANVQPMKLGTLFGM
jgi:hypothetical protein